MNARLLPAPVAVLILVAMILGSGRVLLDLQVNNAIDNYFPPDDPAVVIDREVRERFPEDQVLVALFTGDDLFSDRFLDALNRVVDAMSGHRFVERVITVTTLDHITGTTDGFAVEPLLGPGIAATLTPAQREQRVREDRLASGVLVAEDGSALSLVLRPRPLDNSLQRLELERDFLAAVDAAGLGPWLFGVTGNLALDVAQLRSMIRDTLIFVPATTLLGLLIIAWMFRRPVILGVTAAALLAITASTVALLVLAGRPYTLVSATMPPLLTALSIALLIHFFNALRRMAVRGLQGEAQIAAALDQIREPARYTTLTTFAGLMSLGLSPIRPIAAFGMASAGGVLVLYFVVMVLVPPLLLRWDRGPWQRRASGGAWVDRLVRVLSRIAIRRAGWVLAVAVVGVVAGVPQVLKVQVETDLYRFFAPHHPITRTTKEVEQRLAGVMPLEVVLTGPGRDSLLDPGRLQAISRIQAWLEDHPSVGRTSSMVDIIEDMHWGFHGEDPAYRTLPDDADLISQYLFVYDGRDLYDFVDRDFERARIPMILNVRGAFEIRWVMETLREHLEAEDLGDLEWEIAGIGRMFSDHEKLLITGQVRSLLAVIGLIVAFFLFLWRSGGETVLTLIPNMAPIFLIFVVMGMFGIWLDMATAIVASVAVGVAVDDTIHMFHNFKTARAQGRRVVTALVRTYHQSGRAVVATTIILSAQFLLLLSSEFEPTAHFGLLTAIGITSALVFDVLLLPAIIILFRRFEVGVPSHVIAARGLPGAGLPREPGRVLGLAPEAVLFRRGEQDAYAYFVLEGTVDLLEADQRVVATVEAGGAGAGAPLADARPRPLTARCRGPVTALRLPRAALALTPGWTLPPTAGIPDPPALETPLPTEGPATAVPSPAPPAPPPEEEEDWMSRMLRSDLFTRLPADDIHRIFAAMEPEVYSAGEVVIEQGSPGTGYFLIQEGGCEVTRLPEGAPRPVRLAELGVGDGFGEEALISGQPCSVRVTMLTDGVLMRLAKETFFELIQRPIVVRLDFAAARAQVEDGTAVWVDVRPPEAPGTIPGSVSLPLQLLRMRMRKLRPDLRYVTWCDTGELSASAAFLLSQAGFEAAYLEGGLRASPHAPHPPPAGASPVAGTVVPGATTLPEDPERAGDATQAAAAAARGPAEPTPGPAPADPGATRDKPSAPEPTGRPPLLPSVPAPLPGDPGAPPTSSGPAAPTAGEPPREELPDLALDLEAERTPAPGGGGSPPAASGAHPSLELHPDVEEPNPDASPPPAQPPAGAAPSGFPALDPDLASAGGPPPGLAPSPPAPGPLELELDLEEVELVSEDNEERPAGDLPVIELPEEIASEGTWGRRAVPGRWIEADERRLMTSDQLHAVRRQKEMIEARIAEVRARARQPEGSRDD